MSPSVLVDWKGIAAVRMLRALNPFYWIVHWADWFESRGVHVPGDDAGSPATWRDFGWTIAAWLTVLGVFVVFFAVVS